MGLVENRGESEKPMLRVRCRRYEGVEKFFEDYESKLIIWEACNTVLAILIQSK